MKKKQLLITVLVLAIVLVGGTILYRALSDKIDRQEIAVQGGGTTGPADASEGTEPELIPAPDFTAYDLEGNPVSLSDYLGKKPIVLNFWASWCGPCRSEMADFNEAYLELKDDVQFLMVNMTDGSRETVEIASQFVADHGFEFPVLYDTDGQAAQVYMAYSLPTTYFIDQDGYAIAKASGAISREILQTGIEMILPE